MQESNYLNGREDLISKLRNFSVLNNLNTSHLLGMLQLSKLRIYEADEVITKEGFYDSWIYVLVFGEVKVTKGSSELARFNESGDTFSELSTVDGETRSAAVTATYRTRCLLLYFFWLKYYPDDCEKPIKH